MSDEPIHLTGDWADRATPEELEEAKQQIRSAKLRAEMDSMNRANERSLKAISTAGVRAEPTIPLAHVNAVSKLSTVMGNLMGMQDAVRWAEEGLIPRATMPDFDYLERMIGDIDSAIKTFVPQLEIS